MCHIMGVKQIKHPHIIPLQNKKKTFASLLLTRVLIGCIKKNTLTVNQWAELRI